MYLGIFSACILGLLMAATLLRGRCRHCGVRTYLRGRYCSTCRLIVISYGNSDAGPAQGGSLPAEPAHWTASGSGVTRHESLEGGGFGVPAFLMSFGACVLVVYFFFGSAISSKLVGTAPPAQKSPTPAATKEQVFADRRKRLYYPAQCGGARIPPRDKATFDGEVEAVRAGYRSAGACP